MDNKIYVMIGVSASGKSTTSQRLVDEINGVIVSRDAIRRMIYGYNDSTIHEYYMRPDVPDCEKRVTAFHDIMVREALLEGFDVIADNTHLKIEYIRKYFNYGAEIVPIYVHVELEEAIERDSKREASVGASLITAHYEMYKRMLNKKSELMAELKGHNESLHMKKPDAKPVKKAVIFDIDGTLAHSGSRSPYDYSKVNEDSLDPMVGKVYELMSRSEEYTMFICSGRDESCMKETYDWLISKGINFSQLMMRSNNDNRKDLVVKKEMWERIESLGYSIECMFDDRKQVVDFARSKGYKVFQVERGNF